MGAPALVLGRTWEGGAPVLRVRPSGGRGVERRRLTGAVRLQITAERRCVGYRDARGQAPCPEGAAPVGRQCPACQARDRFRPCLICDGFRCPPLPPAARAACTRTHHLYLACFGGPQLKVGTASHRRREQRIVEQGPLAAARVARGPGPRIKQLETLLVRQPDFVGAMRRSQKTALLGAGVDPAEARRRVEAGIGLLDRRVPADYRALRVAPEWVDLPPLAERARGLPVVSLPVEPDVLVAGQVVGAIGHLLFVEEAAGCLALDLGELVGRVVDFDPAGGRRPAVQLGLFGGSGGAG